MKTIQPFIDANWHTVPLAGELRRLEDGSKTVPVFSKDWKNKYKTTFNEDATALGGAITGECSNIIAIDCDDDATYNLFKALDPEHDLVFLSKDKPSGGATIVYEWSAEAPPTFRLHSTLAQLDFYNDDGFIYLPTEANKSKHTITELPPLRKIPPLVLKLLANFHEQYALSKGVPASKAIDTTQYRSLHGLVEQLTLRKTMDKSMAALTPKDFRDLPAYKQHGYLHPNDVPDGRGSEYLSKLSAILGSDPSIDEDLYVEAIVTVNDMWNSPVPFARLQTTVIKPMISGQATIDGVPLWKYDPDWQDKGFSFTSKSGDLYEAFFDNQQVSWYTINQTDGSIKKFTAQTELLTYVDNIGNQAFKKAEVVRRLPLIRTVVDPRQPEGFLDTTPKQYNLFKRTELLQILQDPTLHHGNYSTPEVTIQFLHSLMPDKGDYDYVLGWLKRKLLKFEYSPVILYFIGVSGSGKDTFVNMIRAFTGPNTFAKPAPLEFVGQFNGWLEHAYFVHLDEYGDQLDKSQAAIAKGRIKSYTGSAITQIRNLHSTPYEAQHNATFVMTANRNALAFDHDDRRFVYINTPNELAGQDWVKLLGGPPELVKRLQIEAKDFAYYLATEIEELDVTAYTSPRFTKAKADAVAQSLPPFTRLAIAVKKHDWQGLELLLLDYGMTLYDLVDARDKIHYDRLLPVASAMYPGTLTTHTLSKELDTIGLTKHRSSRKKDGKVVHTYYIDAPGCFAYAADKEFIPTEGDFE